jgi:hypothetical protein
MKLTGIIAISGKPGLFKVIAQGKNNIIVESFIDGKKSPAYSKDRISSLEDISVYTYEEDIALLEVFERIYNFSKEHGAIPSHKSEKLELLQFMLEIVPNYDQERVYFSDIKKIFHWYQLLDEKGLIQEAMEAQANEVGATLSETEEETETSENTEAPEKPKRAPRKKAVKTEE